MGSIVSAIEELQKDEADRPVIVCNFKLAGSIPRDVHVSVSAHEELANIFNTVNINTACAIVKDGSVPECFLDSYTSLERTSAGNIIVRYPRNQ